MLDTDIEGLGPKEAAEYVLAFIATLKQTSRELERIGEDVSLWRRRGALAREKGQPDLAAQADARAAELEAKQARLEAERQDLARKVSVLKDKLKRISMMGTRLVDTDRLLAELQMLAGEKDNLSISLKDEEAKAELEKLKKRMSGPGNEGGSP
jgi:chaperonin cofactor prefoldin